MPGASVKEPGGHKEHGWGPPAFLYVPSSQKAQLAEAGDEPLWYCPAGHTAQDTVPSWSVKEPGAHSEHSPDPCEPLYVPAPHAVHGPPSGPL